MVAFRQDFTGDAIAKMGQLRELIWNRLTGKHPAEDVALEQAKAGDQSGIDTIAALLGVEMLDEAIARQVTAIADRSFGSGAIVLLGLRYLELILLNLFGYEGVYAYRLKEGRWVGDVKKVPWAK